MAEIEKTKENTIKDKHPFKIWNSDAKKEKTNGSFKCVGKKRNLSNSKNSKAEKPNKKENNEIDFSIKEILLEYMKTGCEQFHQKFEIVKSLKKCGSGYVY